MANLWAADRGSTRRKVKRKKRGGTAAASRRRLERLERGYPLGNPRTGSVRVLEEPPVRSGVPLTAAEKGRVRAGSSDAYKGAPYRTMRGKTTKKMKPLKKKIGPSRRKKLKRR